MSPIFSRVGFNKGFGRRSGNRVIPFSATGGTKYISGIYTIHEFTITDASPFGQPGSTASYTFSWVGDDSTRLTTADLLIVSGGGAGGAGGHYGGGGGAGGYTYIPGINLIPYGRSISVQVGRGGRGSGLGGPENGVDSSFGPIISYGGGAGGSSGQGSSGGSGGGWGTYFQPGATDIGNGAGATRGNHPLSQGNSGGGARNEGIPNTGGGGGGAGSQGSFGQNYPNPPGGTSAGLSNSITGTSITYAIGGPSGGGGAGPGYVLHRGHGGAGFSGGATPFANAGSPGIVIVRYVS
jgi:hypothetical protein